MLRSSNALDTEFGCRLRHQTNPVPKAVDVPRTGCPRNQALLSWQWWRLLEPNGMLQEPQVLKLAAGAPRNKCSRSGTLLTWRRRMPLKPDPRNRTLLSWPQLWVLLEPDALGTKGYSVSLRWMLIEPDAVGTKLCSSGSRGCSSHRSLYQALFSWALRAQRYRANPLAALDAPRIG